MLATRTGVLCGQRFIVRCLCTLAPQVPDSTTQLPSDVYFEAGPKPKKKLKVAILGTPNVGKSTLINKIVGHPVLCVSKRAHTTRHREIAAVVRDSTQIVFVDTPGLVSKKKLKRHNLDEHFLKDGLRAVHEANIVGVVQDVADPFNRSRLNPNILHILHNMGTKKAFLVLNKVDIIEYKKKLLDLITCLTTAPKKSPESSETEIDDHLSFPRYWPNFTEVFMVSALKGNGVSHILDYLLKEAREGNWELPEGEVTNRPCNVILQELVRGRLLDKLPHEVPYTLKIQTEYLHENELGELVAVVLVICPVERYARMLLANSGRIIRDVALQAEADARSALRANVRLRAVVVSKKRKEF